MSAWFDFLQNSDNSFVLHWPWLLCLLPLPFFVRGFTKAQQHQQAALYFPAIETLLTAQDGQNISIKKTERASWWLWLIWLCLVIAATRPQWYGEPISTPTSGRDLLLVVDISGSMQTQDMELNGEPVQRIDAIKKVVSDFAKRREGDRVGLVLFGSKAYLQTPLTFDHATLVQQLQEAQLGFAGEQTAIGDGIALSAKRLEGNDQKNRVMILLTDGANTAGSLTPLQGAEIAQTMGIKVYTVGIGADEMTRRTFFGVQTTNPSQDLDEKTLTIIAEKTGGNYFRARSTEQLEKIYQQLDKLEPITGKQEVMRPVSEWFYWPLAIALLLSFTISIGALWQRYITTRYQHAA